MKAILLVSLQKNNQMTYTAIIKKCDEGFCRFKVFRTSEIRKVKEIRKSYSDRSANIQIP